MTRLLSKSIFGLSTSLFLMGCGATALVSTPVANIDNTPIKIADLTDTQKKNWGHLDLVADTIPGMSVAKAYKQIIGSKKGQKVIVAVLDSGMDLKHEDLDGVLWTNKKEKPGDGKDNDNNGYVDDIHGYDFIGESYNEQLEAARIVRLKLGDATLRAKAKVYVDKETQKYKGYKTNVDQNYTLGKNAHEVISKHLGKKDYTKKDVAAIKTEEQSLLQSKSIVSQMFKMGDTMIEVLEMFEDNKKEISDRLNYHLNIDYDGRKIVGDNPYDITDTGYGDGNPQNETEDESHATHVAGIIAAERNNGKGIKGIANNVAIMSIRSTPRGDEYDKDVALGIRYAVDNGAKIINASFGKSFSPKAEWVYEAIKYAAAKDVLFIHAAGNDGANIDSPKEPNFPNDAINNGPEISNNVITVGALTSKYGSEMVASFSNYGKINVDVFAPGDEIYSTMPNNKYEYQGGTSMAAPAVAGVAALIRSQYPKLSAYQVKKIIMKSGLPIKAKVLLAGDPSKAATLDTASKSGKIVNAYNALLMAKSVSEGKIQL